MKTRRQFLTHTLRGLASLSAIAFLGMRVPEEKTHTERMLEVLELWKNANSRTNWEPIWKDITENWSDPDTWALKPGGTLHYNGQLSQKGILYFTAPTTRGQG